MRQDLREADQAGVRDAHGDVGILVQEIQYRNEGVLVQR